MGCDLNPLALLVPFEVAVPMSWFCGEVFVPGIVAGSHSFISYNGQPREHNLFWGCLLCVPIQGTEAAKAAHGAQRGAGEPGTILPPFANSLPISV